MDLANELDQLIDHVLVNKTSVIFKNVLVSLEELLKNKVVTKINDDDERVRLNPTSLKLAERLIIKQFENIDLTPSSVQEAIESVNVFKEFICGEFAFNNNNGTLRELMLSLTALHFSKLKEKGIDILAIVKEQIDNKEYRDYQIFDAFFIHLINDNYDIGVVYQYCQECAISNDGRISRVLSVLNNFRPDEIVQLYEYGISKEEFYCCEFQLRIILLAFLLEGGEVLTDIDQIYERFPGKGLKLLSRLSLSSKDIDRTILLSEKVINDFAIVDDQNEFLFSIAQNEFSSQYQRKQLYGLWNHLMKNTDNERRKSIIKNIGLIESAEDEKYKYIMLVNYLNLTEDFSIVSSFLQNFETPNCLYEMLGNLYQKAEGRKNSLLNVFRSALVHFFRKDPITSELLILKFFDSQYGLGTLPIDIMTLDLPEVFPVDLLKLETEDLQIGSIRKFEFVTFGFDKMVPILLKLRSSKFPNVVLELQNLLSGLAFEVYGDLMISWVEQYIGKDKKSKAFLKPIIDAVEKRKLLMEKKMSIADLNPIRNETNLVELYHSLQKEAQDKSFSKARSKPGFLMSLMKNTSIVRGNAWRHGDCDSKVSGLTNVSTGFVIDSRIYKNPDLFEFQIKNFEG